MRARWRQPRPRLTQALIALALLAASAREGRGQQDPFRSVDTTFARWRSGPPRPAVGLAVVQDGRVVYRAIAGYADLERLVRAGDETRFDWASIGKQFTAFAVSQLVSRGLLRPDDEVRRFIPELDLGGARITIDQLLHHTAGVDDVDGLLALSGWRTGDLVRHADLVRLLARQQTLRFPPGTAHAYSNGGYTLLAEVVARVTGTDFVRWTDSALFARVGMPRSGFLATPLAMVPGRALPYVPVPGTANGWRPSTADTYPGAGGLYATIDDLATWARHLLQPTVEAEATRRLFTRGRLANGDTIGYAWGVGHGDVRGVPSISHGGSGPATSAFIQLIPSLGVAVVVATAGEGDADVGALARRALLAAVGDRLPPEPAVAAPSRVTFLSDAMLHTPPDESRGVVPARRDLQGVAGRYRFDDGSWMALRVVGDSLQFAFEARPPYYPLHPLPGGRFVLMPLWDVIRFERGADGQAVRLVREATARSPRQRPPAVAQRVAEVTFTEADAAAYVGWYFSDALQALYGVRRTAQGRLELLHPRHGVMPMALLEGERFAVDAEGIVGARFGRLGGEVVGMELEARSWGVRASFRRVMRKD